MYVSGCIHGEVQVCDDIHTVEIHTPGHNISGNNHLHKGGESDNIKKPIFPMYHTSTINYPNHTV